MSALVFLGVAVVMSALGGLLLWLRYREPRSMEARMREFARELDALSPDNRLPTNRPPSRGRRSA